MEMRLKGVEEINAKLQELKALGVSPSFGQRRKAIEAGALILKQAVQEAAPSRSAAYVAKGKTFGMSKKAQLADAEYRAGRVFNASISRGKVKLKRGGRKAMTLKESIRYDAMTGSSRQEVNIKVYARKPTAHLVEFGHRTRQGTGKSKYYKPKPGGKASISAVPFMEAAFAANSQKAIDAIADQLNIRLDKMLKRAIKASKNG